MMSVIADSDMYILAGPLVLTFFISYAVADMFMDVFEIAILTILHCFVADEEMFNGRARYAQGDLTQWIDKNAATNG
jgi:Plasma-membrane choline transporter